MGKQENILMVQEMLAHFKENLVSLITTEYSSRIILQCFQFCSKQYQLQLSEEIYKHLDAILDNEYGRRIVKYLLDKSSIEIRRHTI